MKADGARVFWQALDPAQRAWLRDLRSQACQTRPEGWVNWRCAGAPLGCVPEERAVWMARQLPLVSRSAQVLDWQAGAWTPAQRSAQLQSVLVRAREEGLLAGWRDERFSFWSSDCAHPDPQRPAFLQVERSGFRFLGMLSHAVHVNGFLYDGRLWCGRRALHKATDPGMLDNVTAGGLPCGESIRDCLRRELAEEAGLFQLEQHDCCAAGIVRTARRENEGWHDEYVHVFNLTLAAGFEPRNQDGEVAEFLCLEPAQVLRQMQAAAFTQDAVQALAQGLAYQEGELAAG